MAKSSDVHSTKILPRTPLICRTIVRQFSSSDSEESGKRTSAMWRQNDLVFLLSFEGWKSDDEEIDDKETSQQTTIIETSSRTLVDGSDYEPHSIGEDCNDDVISLENTTLPIVRNLAELQYQHSHDSRDQVSLHSRPISSKIGESNSFEGINISREPSMNSLRLPPLRITTTNDSGTGGSITNLPHRVSLSTIPFDELSVYGFEEIVAMPNRFDFDPSKVMAHRLRQGSISSHMSTLPTAMNKSHESKKTGSLWTKIRPKKSSPPSASAPPTPLVRHHSTRPSIDETQ